MSSLSLASLSALAIDSVSESETLKKNLDIRKVVVQNFAKTYWELSDKYPWEVIKFLNFPRDLLERGQKWSGS